jgi:hypothetical protein
MGAINRKLPLATEIALVTGLGVVGDKGDEKPTRVDPFMNLPVPGIPSAQLALIKPYLDTCGSESLADSPCRFRIL